MKKHFPIISPFRDFQNVIIDFINTFILILNYSEKRDVSSAKSFTLDLNSFLIDLWVTPGKTGLQGEVCPFNTTLWNLPGK